MPSVPSPIPAPLGRRYWPLMAVLAAVLIGAALRLVWVGDMEWKGDEQWMFQQTQQIHRWDQLPWKGDQASVGLPNLGLGVWVFVALSKLIGAVQPTDLARAVQLSNVVALGLLVVFAYRIVPKEEREPWLWAIALVAVNPLAVLLERKIWTPSVFPLFTVLLLFAWSRRDRRLGAFFFGLIGACLGQIHMSGFFFAGGFALWALLFDRRGVAWGAWLAGSVLGTLPMIPWLLALAAAHGHASLAHRSWLHLLEFKFWGRWIQEAFGLGIDYTLEDQFRDFLTYPHIWGRATYLVGALHGVLGAVALFLLPQWVRSLWKRRGEWRQQLAGTGSPSAFTQNAALWGFGLLLTASCASLNRHYMAVLFPLEFLWVARVALARPDAGPRAVRWGRVSLATLWIAQLLISVQFLDYIHVKQRINGEYGPTYASQQLASRK